jgi:asparagine synthase (glutamine-hydrolysing)
VAVEQYWDVTTEATDRPAHEYVTKYRELLENSVSSHLMSDVPLGVFLSGGVDSSSVAALASKIRSAPVETFSVGYAESSYSELPAARAVAEHLKSVHHEVVVSCDDFFNALPMLTWHEDEPIVWPSSVSLYFVSRLAKEHVKVVLTGEGADETLAGYTRYAFTLKNAAFDRYYRSMFPDFLRRGVKGFISSSHLLTATVRRKLAHTFLARDGASWEEFYFDNFLTAFSADEQTSLLSEQAGQELNEGDGYKNVLDYWKDSHGEMLQRLLYTDLKTYLVELLMKQDNMSMAASIESRVPFLDHELVEFALTIPQTIQISGLAGKQVLKRAMADLLPQSVLHQPKLGFPTPWREWLTGPKFKAIETILLEPRSMDRGLFRRSSIERLFREHEHGFHDHADHIWRLMTLELWHRVCLEGEAHEFGRVD